MPDAGKLIGRSPATGAPMQVSYAAGVITAIEPLPPDAVQHCPYLTPGLIDIQVNGYAGHDLNSGSVGVDEISALARALRAVGTLTFMPTLVTASEAFLLDTLSSIARARKHDPDLAHAIPRIHIEGPWISAEDGPRGAHAAQHVRAPSIEEFERWQDAAGGIVGVVTLSPHFEQARAITAALVARGITVAIGHTSASDSQIDAVVAAGASISTHLGNGIAGILKRHPNAIWTQLGDDRLQASLIADGFHLAPSVFRSMLRAKGLKRTILVSDSAREAGMLPGRYSGTASKVELSPEGRLGLVGTDYLAGSGMNLSQCVTRAIIMGNIELADALQLATHNPGCLIGGRGRLEVGAPADLITFNWQPGAQSLAIVDIVANGRIVQ